MAPHADFRWVVVAGFPAVTLVASAAAPRGPASTLPQRSAQLDCLLAGHALLAEHHAQLPKGWRTFVSLVPVCEVEMAPDDSGSDFARTT
jgi:hypothetical protein